MKNISLGTHFQGLNRQFSFSGLLDKFGGAAAGYSLRKLAKDAVNAVRVRRSSDNTETDIGFTKKGELDTTTLLDFVNARDVAPADYGAGAAAAYSLRYVSDSYTGDVVRVRRSVDNAEADFNPTEITDGTLAAWVGGQNLILYSEQIDNPYWDKINAQIGVNATTAPDSTITAEKITGDGTSTLVIARRLGFNLTANDYTLSFYAKADTYDIISVGVVGFTSATGSTRVYADLTNGIASGGTITAAGNGWYRISTTFKPDSSDLSGDIQFTLAKDLSNVSFDSNADTSGKSVFVWGAQLEEGSSVGDYNPTTSNVSGYGYVTTWYDQSGNSNDATQGTAASQPKIVDAGVLVEENGKPAVDFTEANQQRLFTTYVLNSEFSIFTTQKVDKTVVVVLGDERLSSLPANTFCIAILGTGEFGIRTSPTLDTAGAINIATQFQTTFISDGLGGISYYADSLLTDTTTGNQVSFTQNINIGGVSDGYADRTLDGRLSEVIIYDTDQSSNRGNIEANVNDYYSIYTSTNDGFVTTWYDQAGSNDATQATAAAQPQIVDGGSLITDNGKPSVYFDGVNDALNAASANLVTENSAYSVFTVGLSNTVVSGYYYWGINANDNGIGAGRAVGFTPEFAVRVTGNAIFSDSASGSQELLSLLYDGTTIQNHALYIDGTNSAVSSSVNGNSPMDIDNGDFRLGGWGPSNTNFLDGDIQEVIIYSSDQSGNRTAIEGNINKNYQMYWDGAGYSLLDNFAGAEAAYALVPLSSTYRGAIVKVRRASDNAERDIYANYDGTLDTASLLDFCSGTDGYVSVWYDQSGNGNNAVQSTAASQPQIVSGGSLITSNGYTVIQYDGTDDNLTTSLTATGTMLMGGSDGSAFYEVAISGSYSLLSNVNLTDHPLNESIRVIWGSSLTTAQKSAIEAAVTYTDWDFSDVTSFVQYWRQRSELTHFPLIDTSNGTNFADAWILCPSLTSFPALNVSSGTNFFRAWYGCSSLTSFPALDISSGTTFYGAWQFCSSLQDFPANMFDSVTGTNFTNAFLSTNLTQTSIDNILTSIDTANTSNGTFDQSGGSAPSAVGEAAIENLISRGWTITVTGGYQTYPTYKYRVETDGGTLYASRACTETAINDLKAL